MSLSKFKTLTKILTIQNDLIMTNSIFTWMILFALSISTAMAQEIVELPLTKTDDNVKWERAEQDYYSKIWNTQVITNVSKPTMEVFRPAAGTANGTAVIVCPGGGLYALSIESEGDMVAEWLQKRGVTAFVLRYRLVPTKEDGVAQLSEDGLNVITKAKEVLPLSTADGLNAIEYVRTNAEEYGINPEQIGIMGFSAGGAVTMNVTYNYEEKNRPNFIAPIYAWMNVVPPSDVPTDAPPMFALCASDDPLMLAPASVKLYSDWLKARKQAELHMYSTGGHGFGMKANNVPADNWIERFGDWLAVNDWMDKRD